MEGGGGVLGDIPEAAGCTRYTGGRGGQTEEKGNINWQRGDEALQNYGFMEKIINVGLRTGIGVREEADAGEGPIIRNSSRIKTI